ncbi:MAG: S41 family peptidase [Anaerolineales bacterium]
MTYKLTRTVVIGAFALFGGAGFFAGGFVTGMRFQERAFEPGQVIGLPPGSGGGFAAPFNGNVEPIDPVTAGTPPELADTFEPFWESWSLLHENFYEQPLDDEALTVGAIRGMLAATGDRHTTYMTSAQLEVMQSDLEGELEGIGAEVEQFGDYIRIVSPLPGSAAEEAGLLSGDVIVEVDGEDIFGRGLFDIITLVRGPAGTTVTLGIDRTGEPDILYFTIERYHITLPSVTSDILPSGMAYVKINQFGENTIQQLRDNLETVLRADPPGLILDLRNNPGGLLNSSISVASQFIGDGTVVIEQFSDGERRDLTAQPGGLAVDIPLAVLINGGSASASEIVAGAVQDYERGLLVGETSFGKGTVQNLLTLSDDNGAMRVTFARWLTPNGRWIHNEGLEPDVSVELTPDDRAAGLDPQLDAAEQLLLQGVELPTAGAGLALSPLQ